MGSINVKVDKQPNHQSWPKSDDPPIVLKPNNQQPYTPIIQQDAKEKEESCVPQVLIEVQRHSGTNDQLNEDD